MPGTGCVFFFFLNVAAPPEISPFPPPPSLPTPRPARPHPKLLEAPAGLSLEGVHPAEQLAVLRDVAEGIKVGAGMAAHHDHLIGCRSAISAEIGRAHV